MTVIVDLLPRIEAAPSTLAAERSLSLVAFGPPHTPPLSDQPVSRESIYDKRG